MNNFDEFKKVAKETMETIADRSVELYKVAEEKTKIIARRTKLSAEIAVEKGGVRNLFKEIGKVYYELHKDEPEMALKPLCAEIDDAMKRVDEKQKELDELKNGTTYTPEYEPVQTDEYPSADAEEASAPAAETVQTPTEPPQSTEPESTEPQAQPSQTYAAPFQDEVNTPPTSGYYTPPQSDGQNNNPPEFKL